MICALALAIFIILAGSGIAVAMLERWDESDCDVRHGPLGGECRFLDGTPGLCLPLTHTMEGYSVVRHIFWTIHP